MTPQKILKQVAGFVRKEPIYVIGGAVRDRLLRRPTLDYDLVIDKNPQALAKKIANKIKGKSFVLDSKRLVYRISHPSGLQIDISKIQGTSFQQDIDRRDITVNALAVPLASWHSSQWKKFIVDRHQGVKNLKKKNISLVSEKALKDDPLRILRCYRMAAELDFLISPQTRKALKKYSKSIKKPAPERIREEILKIFSTPQCYPVIIQMEKDGIWDIILPEVKSLRKTGHDYYGKGGVLKHTLDAVFHLESVCQNLRSWFPRYHKKIKDHLEEKLNGYPRIAHLKWGTLLHDFGKPATAKIIKGRLRFFDHEYVGANKILKFANRFRWSNDEKTRYAKLVRHHMRPGNLATHEDLTDKAIHRFFRDLDQDAIGMLLVSLGDHLTYLTPKELKKRASDHEKVTIRLVNHYFGKKKKVLPPKIINGHTLMSVFKLKPSPLVGQLLNLVTEAQSEGLIGSKSEALEFLKKQIKDRKIKLT